MVVLYESENLLIRYVRFSEEFGPIMVLFPALDEFEKGLHKKGFGEDVYAQKRIDHIIITCIDNSWFQYDDMSSACAAIKSVTCKYRRVISYGSSMGGYGAIAYSGWIGADAAIAMAPQYSVDPRKMPQERRWKKFTKRIEDFLCDDIRSQSLATCHNYVFYDPFYEGDVKHVQALRRIISLEECYLSFGGHLCAALASEAKILKPAIDSIIENRFDRPLFVREMRSRRSQLLRTWVMLSSRAMRYNKFRLAEKAAVRALEINPENQTCIDVLRNLRERANSPSATKQATVHVTR